MFFIYLQVYNKEEISSMNVLKILKFTNKQKIKETISKKDKKDKAFKMKLYLLRNKSV